LFFLSFSSTQIPQFQLFNAMALGTLIGNFGTDAGFAIFEDADPTTSQVRSSVTVMPNRNATPHSSKEAQQTASNFTSFDEVTHASLSKNAKRIKRIKEFHKKLIPSLGSNGQVIGPEKSASGNPLLRCAIQSNFNHPGDFYQVKVKDSFFTGNYFIVPGIPFGIGTYNTFGLTVQVGHLPTNDFLVEPTSNIISSRIEPILVFGADTVLLPVFRSSSGGWVIDPEYSPTQILTLRSSFIDRQLQGLNIVGDFPFIHSVPEFYRRALAFDHTSDLIGFQGQCADCHGNYGAFQATDWTQLPEFYDRRLPQGIFTAPPPNSLYQFRSSARKPMFDLNNKKGYYSGWNNVFKQFAEGSADVVTGIPLSRAYWLTDYIDNILHTNGKISFDQLRETTFREAVANSIIAFKNDNPTAYADLFSKLFKNRFFEAITPPTNPNQVLALSLLADFDGRWYEGDKATVISTSDVSDKFLLASAWLLNVAGAILNPIVGDTFFEVKTLDPTLPPPFRALPTFNDFDLYNDLATYQGNLLARILGLSTDNTLLFPDWLDGINVDNVIKESLDTAIANLGGSPPWGIGTRQNYVFSNAVLGPLPMTTTKMFNSSSLYFVAEFGPKGIKRFESTLPLGESGFISPSFTFDINNFNQLPFYQSYTLIPN